MKSMLESFMTEEIIMSEYSDIVLSDLPQKLGKSSESRGKSNTQSSLTATKKTGEYEFQQIAKAELSKNELKDPQLKDNPVIQMFTEFGALGKLMGAFVDSLKIESTTNGVICSNGIPKHFVKEYKIIYSMMGQEKESTEKVTISMIDESRHTQQWQ